MKHLTAIDPGAWKNRLDALEQMAHTMGMTTYDAKFSSFRQRLLDKEFRLAVVGQFSSGKSTFINAIIGKDILSHTLSETTATITRIVNVAAGDSRARTGLITFRNGASPKVLRDFSELRTYTTKQSETYEVARDIESVELYVPFLHDDTPLVIVDTPGLNGLADLELQTYELVREAHACLYLLPSRGLSEKDVDFIEELKDFQKSFVFIQSFLDQLRPEEGETPDIKLEDLKKNLTAHVFSEDGDDFSWSICGVSALYELAGRDHGIRRLYQGDTHDLTPEDRKTILAESHFSDFRAILSERFSGAKLDEIRYRDTAAAICRLAAEIQARMAETLGRKEQIWSASTEAKNVSQLERREENLRKWQRDQELALCGLVARYCDETQQENKTNLQKWSRAFLEKQSEELDARQTPEDIEQYAKELPRFVQQEIRNWSRRISAYMEGKFQELHQVILEDIHRYTTKNLENMDGGILQMRRIDLPEQAMTTESSSEERMWAQIRKKEAQLAKVEREAIHAKERAQQYQEEAEQKQRNIGLVKQSEQAQLNQMGGRPEPEKEERTVEPSGLWGKFKSIFFDPDTEIIEDDSNVRAWEAQRRKIQNEAADRIGKCQQELITARRKWQSAENDQTIAEETKRTLQNDLKNLQTQLEREKRHRQETFRLARQELIKLRRKRVKEHLKKYFSGDAASEGQLSRMEHHLKTLIDSEQKRQQEDALTFYRHSLDEELKDIRANREDLQKEIEVIRTQKASVDALVKELEERP